MGKDFEEPEIEYLQDDLWFEPIEHNALLKFDKHEASKHILFKVKQLRDNLDLKAQLRLFVLDDHKANVQLTSKESCIVQITDEKSHSTIELEKIQRIVRH